MENVKLLPPDYRFPWYGNYCLMLTCTSCNGERFRHPVTWDYNMKRLDNLYRSFMRQWYNGKLEELPVIVDYTGMRKQILPESYNDIPKNGEQLTLNL